MEKAEMPVKGEQAPDFELVNQDGRKVKLSDLRGRRVVMFAYPKAGTSGCTTQACGFRDQFPRFDANNIVVLGLSPDAPKDLLKWRKAENLPYDLLSDPDHQVLEAWGAWGEKSMYGKAYMGVIRSHWIIDENGVIVDEQLNVKPLDSVERAVKAFGW
ncbi:MAG: thioredoxin-dependent thiol peroxidase [Anaerolineae bacterium]|nr:thioredoxin-dependent thiol peroxidase [Anaerolineae bacterium]